jgi:hypothetical protein
MGKVFTFLILLGGLVGAYFVISEKLVDKRVKGNPWIADIRDQIAKSRDAGVQSVADVTSDGRLWRVLSLMHEAERGSYDVETTLGSATSGGRNGEAKMIQDAGCF